jgi:hypothetical protein
MHGRGVLKLQLVLQSSFLVRKVTLCAYSMNESFRVFLKYYRTQQWLKRRVGIVANLVGIEVVKFCSKISTDI